VPLRTKVKLEQSLSFRAASLRHAGIGVAFLSPGTSSVILINEMLPRLNPGPCTLSAVKNQRGGEFILNFLSGQAKAKADSIIEPASISV
jgi:hypothetical protein